MDLRQTCENWRIWFFDDLWGCLEIVEVFWWFKEYIIPFDLFTFGWVMKWNLLKNWYLAFYRQSWEKLNYLVTVKLSLKSFEDIIDNSHGNILTHISLRWSIWSWQPWKQRPKIARCFNCVIIQWKLTNDRHLQTDHVCCKLISLACISYQLNISQPIQYKPFIKLGHYDVINFHAHWNHHTENLKLTYPGLHFVLFSTF